MVSGRSVPFRGALAFEQYRDAMGLHQRGVVAIPLWLLAALVALAGATLLLLGDRWLGLFFLGAVALLLIALGLRRWTIRKGWDTYELIREPVHGSVADDGLTFEGEHGAGRIPWDRFHQWQGSEELLLVYQNHQLFHVLPRSFFDSDESWTTATSLVASRLPPRRRHQRKTFLGLLGFGVLVVVIVVVLLVVVRLSEGP